MSGVVLISTAEFALKSPPVRRLLLRLLKRHIRFRLKQIGVTESKITSAGGFLVVGNVGETDHAARNLARIFGVAHADACELVNVDIDDIIRCVSSLAETKMTPGETFAVRARKFEPSRVKGKEIEIHAGTEILSRFQKRVRVNLSSPDRTFRVFYGLNVAFVSATRFDGPGGLPVGSQGMLLGLATDSSHSLLSFYLLMKRGAMVWPVIPDIRYALGETSVEAVLNGLRTLAPFVPKKGFSAHLIKLDEDPLKQLDGLSDPLRRVFSIRLTFRAIAHLVHARKALGLVTGERLASDGLESLKGLSIAGDFKFPVYRPLLTMDEQTLSLHLRELNLVRPKEKAVPTHGLSRALDDTSLMKLRELEERLRFEQLAQRIAAGSTKIPI